MQPGIGIAPNSSQRRDLRMLFRYTHPKPEEVAGDRKEAWRNYEMWNARGT
jgi:hypothetical protein